MDRELGMTMNCTNQIHRPNKRKLRLHKTGHDESSVDQVKLI